MPYRVETTDAAGRQIRKLSVEMRRRVIARSESLSDDPRPPGSIKLAGQQNLYRIRIGDWRVLYQIDDALAKVTITLVAHRRESYRGL